MELQLNIANVISTTKARCVPLSEFSAELDISCFHCKNISLGLETPN